MPKAKTNKQPSVAKKQPAAKANTAKAAPTPPAPTAQPALPPAPEGFINVFVDGQLLHVKKGSTVMQACTLAAKEIPHFCYHERLSIAGNCRMCLVEIEGAPKPVASCHWPASEGMRIRTDSQITRDARKGTMELLLINHPLDCPICDQGGECALQDQSVGYGGDRTHYNEFKRAVDDKDIGSKIKTVMTRCIHCTRCIRFATEVAGVEEMGATFRGENMQVGTYVEQAIQSELSGNMIDLCPVGALTSKPYAYTARPWELARTNSTDMLDAVGTPITVDTRAGQVMRTLPQEHDEINEEWMTDAARFSYDALAANRLTSPMVKKGGKLNGTGWPVAFQAITAALATLKPQHVAGLLGSMQTLEDAASFKAFLTQTLGTAAFDCRTPGSTLTQATLAAPLASLESTDAVLLVGANPRWEAPLINLRLRRAAVRRKVPVALIGAPASLTYPHQHLGEGAAALEELVKGKSAFAKTLKAAKNPTILISASVFTRPDAAAVMALAGKLGPVGVLADTPGRISAIAAGVLPQGKGGSDTAAILKGWKSGAVKLLFVYGEDTVTAEDLKGGKGTLVYIGTHRTALASVADICLPAAAWAEKNGSVFNGEGRLLPLAAATQPPLNAKEDWKIFRALSEACGKTLPFDTFAQLKRHIAPQIEGYSDENIGKIVAKTLKPAKPEGALKLHAKSFDAPVSHYYLRLEYLRQSATMHACQTEAGTAKIKAVAA